MLEGGRAGPRAAAAAVTVALLVSCTGTAGTARTTRASRNANPAAPVVVASFNFPESILLAEIYAGALEGAGIPVRREDNLGPRELVEPALQQHLVDLVPEYLGTALASLRPGANVNASDAEAVRRELGQALAPWAVQVLTPAPAQDQNGFVVTRATATRLGLRAVSDLAAVTSGLTLGGPPECPTRAFCLEGLRRVYGVDVARFVAFDTEQERVTALDQGVIDVALMFTTDADLATGDLVLLADDRRLQPAENVVPVVTGRALDRWGARLTAAVDAVSARLTQNVVVFLNWRVQVAGRDPAAEARGWLSRQGLAHGP